LENLYCSASTCELNRLFSNVALNKLKARISFKTKTFLASKLRPRWEK